MKTTEKIEKYYNLIQEINYHNSEGGKYAYVQFLAYSRELLVLLQPIKSLQKEIAAIEQIQWLFNGYLEHKFTDHQKLIFDSKRREIKNIFGSLINSVREAEIKNDDKSVYLNVAGVSERPISV